MNYHYVLSTGQVSISGSLGDTLDRNSPSEFFNNNFTYNPEVITGVHRSLISINSQTLFEETAIHVDGQNISYDYINTGDYFVTPSDELYFNSFRVDSGLSISSSDTFVYDKRDFYTGAAIYKTNTGVGYWYTYVTNLGNIFYNRGEAVSSVQQFQSGWDIFFNGQKITTTGQIPELDIITGKIFALKKRSNITGVESIYPDIYGTSFIEDQVDYYINGMEQLESEFLQLYTGVTLVKTGVNCYVPIINIEESSYSL